MSALASLLRPVTPRDLRGTWPRALGALAGSLLLICTIRWALIEPYVIPSESMVPTLLVHDHIFVNKFAYGIRLPFAETYLFNFAPPKRGDVVVFRSIDDSHVFLVKRVVGLPGDDIQLKDDGLYVSGARVPTMPMSDVEQSQVLEDWTKEARTDAIDGYEMFNETLGEKIHPVFRDKFARGAESQNVKVPMGHLFMSGDNRDHSADSRTFGFLPLNHVLGRASLIWLSCEEALAQSGQLCNPQRMRWRRLFKRVK